MNERIATPIHAASDALTRPCRRSAALAVAALAVCCLCWGFSFPIMPIAAREIEGAAGLTNSDTRLELSVRATFNGWRFTAAAIAYALLTITRQRGFTRDELLGGFLVGLTFGAGMFLQVLGLRYTRPSVSAFLTALAVVYAPIAQAALLRRPVGMRVWFAVCIAMIGTAVLSQSDAATSRAPNAITTTPPVPYLGEVLTIVAALMFTGQILAVDRFGRASDPSRLTLVMLATTSILSLICGALLSDRLHHADVLRQLAHSDRFWWTFASLVLFSSVLALHLMNACQPAVAPATAAVVYCLEPPFATLFSVAFRTEHLTRNTVIGGAIVLAAVLIVVPWKQRRQRHRS